VGRVIVDAPRDTLGAEPEQLRT